MSSRSRLALFGISLLLGLLVLTGQRAFGQSLAARAGRCPAANRVQSVKFIGQPKFPAVEMAALIVNEQPGFFSKLLRRNNALCVDTLEVQRDALRLAVLHRQHGWFLATVTPRYDRRPGGIWLQFDVASGPEARIDTVIVAGLPLAETGRAPFEAPLLALGNKRFDRVRVQGVIDTVVNRLRDVGYARATRPLTVITIDTVAASDSTPGKVRLAFTFATGARLRVAEVHVRVQGIGTKRTVDSADIMALTRLRAGELFRASNVVNAQRDLHRTDAFRLVLIDTIAPRVGSADSLIDLQVTVAEARTRTARAGAGWATQDCGRVQARAQDRAFLAPGRRAELSMRASKIGIGAPLDFAERLCANSLRSDPFSEKLNYYVGTTVSNTRFFGYSFAPTFSLYSERRGEPHAYLRETQIGSLFELSSTKWLRTVVTSGMQYERGRTISDPLVSCTRFGLCQPQDEKVSLFGQGVGVVSTSFAHDRTSDVANPVYGSRYRIELRAGQTSTKARERITFYRGTGEVAAFTAFFGGTVASRMQVARVFAPGAPVVNGSTLLPQQERLFAGGQNSVRGFQQNLLGPVVYAFKNGAKVAPVERDGQKFLEVRPDSTNGTDGALEYVDDDLIVPRGGTALVVGNLEWRRRVRWPTNKLQIALFADAGTVFESNEEAFDWSNVRVTPGIGARLDTPLGPFRVDLGYNPYKQQTGRALYFTKQGIQCVSPGNTIALSASGTSSLDLSKCPESYPPPSRGILSRVVFHFSLGQAF